MLPENIRTCIKSMSSGLWHRIMLW